MRILHGSFQARTVDHASGPVWRLGLGAVAPGLNVYRSGAPTDSATVADALSHLVFGIPDQRWGAIPYAAAQADVSQGSASLRLRRAGERGAPRLTFTTLQSSGDRRADDPTAWLGDVSPQALGAIFFSSRDEVAPLLSLLSPTVAETFNHITPRGPASALSSRHDAASLPEAQKRLFRRRDELACRLEECLSEGRGESQAIDARLEEIERQRKPIADQAIELGLRLRTAAEELQAALAQTRYEELSRDVEQQANRETARLSEARTEDLDSEVARWRATLAELESRESAVRQELAAAQPRDASPRLTTADQRAGLAVARRLTADLESEVARFAQSGLTPQCLCDEAHPRLNPLVEMLGQQIDRLTDLVDQQERALRSQELSDEAQQLERSQTELRRQLDHLLQQRQTLWRAGRSRITSEKVTIESPVEWIGQAQRAHDLLAEELKQAEASLAALDRERDELVTRRRRLLGTEEQTALRQELERVQSEIHALGRHAPGAPQDASVLRASDVLASLTDGALTELRLTPGGRTVEARTLTGELLPHELLSDSQQRLVAWALRLAIADGCCQAGYDLPLVLDEPFVGLDDSQTANLATALDDFQRRGRQVVVLTGCRVALERFASLNVGVRPLGANTPAPVPPVEATRSVVRQEVVRRGLLLDVDDEAGRFPASIAGLGEALGVARVKTIGDLIRCDPSALADELATEAVTPELVSLWQAHAALVCFVPGLEMNDAKQLAECGVLSVAELAEADAEQLCRIWRREHKQEAGLARLENWIEQAVDGIDRWNESGYAQAWARNLDERREWIARNAKRNATPTKTKAKRKPKPQAKPEPKPRFFLETSSPIVDAPSIGPKRAAELNELEIETVAHLLESDPESLADALEDSRVKAARVVAWQHEAGLVCRVPGLRGHDAQILVGCGFTSPEEIASMQPSELLEFVEPFCDTPRGQRVLRGGRKPDLAEVKHWIESARHRRAIDTVTA